MSKESKSELLSYLFDRKKYKDLYELLLGVSDANVAASLSDEPSLDVVKLVSAARNHLAFLDRFGDLQNHVCVDDIHYFAYPDEYAKWLSIGAPGVSVDELRRAIRRI